MPRRAVLERHMPRVSGRVAKLARAFAQQRRGGARGQRWIVFRDRDSREKGAVCSGGQEVCRSGRTLCRETPVRLFAFRRLWPRGPVGDVSRTRRSPCRTALPSGCARGKLGALPGRCWSRVFTSHNMSNNRTSTTRSGAETVIFLRQPPPHEPPQLGFTCLPSHGSCGLWRYVVQYTSSQSRP